MLTRNIEKKFGELNKDMVEIFSQQFAPLVKIMMNLTFSSNFQKLLNDINNRKPSLSVVTGDFNSRCSSW